MNIKEVLHDITKNNKDEFVASINKKIISLLREYDEISFHNGSSISDYLSGKAPGATGQFYSFLSTAVSNKIIAILNSKNPNIICEDVDGHDFAFINNSTKEFGEMKINFDCDSPIWTGNGCKKHAGTFFLIKLTLDKDCSLNDTNSVIKKIWIGVIEGVYVEKKRGKGKSDMAILRILNDNAQNLKSILGGIKKTKKFIHFAAENL